MSPSDRDAACVTRATPKKQRRSRLKDFQGARTDRGKPRKDRVRSVMRRWRFV